MPCLCSETSKHVTFCKTISVKVVEEQVQDGTTIHPTASSSTVAVSETSAYTGAGDNCILSIVPVLVKSKKGNKRDLHVYRPR